MRKHFTSAKQPRLPDALGIDELLLIRGLEEATAVARSILPSSELLQTLDNVGASIQNFRLKPRRSESSSCVQITDTQAHRWITGKCAFSLSWGLRKRADVMGGKRFLRRGSRC